MEKSVTTNTLLKTIKAIEWVGEKNFNKFIDKIIFKTEGEIEEDENTKNFITHIWCQNYDTTIKEIKKGAKFSKDMRDGLSYLLNKYTDMKHIDIAFEMGIRYPNTISKGIKRVKNLSDYIPYEKEFKNKILFISKIIEEKIKKDG